MSHPFDDTPLALLTAKTNLNETSGVLFCRGISRIRLYFTYPTGVTTGEVIVESSDDPAFAGTWANEGNSVGGSNKKDSVLVEGPLENIRVRIGTAISGGGSPSVTVTATRWIGA